jgi:excisionase family DNA binding protein
MGAADMQTSSVNKPRLLTTKEAEEFLELAEGTLPIWRCKQRHKIPYIKIGRNVRYREDDLLEWLESRTVRQAEPAHA